MSKTLTLENEYFIQISPVIKKKVGSSAAQMLQEIYRMLCDSNLGRTCSEGYRWVWYTDEELAEKIGISKSTIFRARKLLKSLGLIVVEKFFNEHKSTTCHYRLTKNYKAILSALPFKSRKKQAQPKPQPKPQPASAVLNRQNDETKISKMTSPESSLCRDHIQRSITQKHSQKQTTPVVVLPSQKSITSTPHEQSLLKTITSAIPGISEQVVIALITHFGPETVQKQFNLLKARLEHESASKRTVKSIPAFFCASVKNNWSVPPNLPDPEEQKQFNEKLSMIEKGRHMAQKLTAGAVLKLGTLSCIFVGTVKDGIKVRATEGDALALIDFARFSREYEVFA